ncbi:MAG: hypothetical protein HC836_24410 [Richelia sp. RM2_1_2]|nr:hypothetical protein [Richelia sp. SM2_1_7]NJM23006.1 hypothetical protein [Richelia sp. SM1_7_0]NJN07271.1 hypothetical protein [Richelia sp. RM1_1_1]NJO30100.1 hypothetical protein [Richelia sp. SL_2_1]NJO61280.1 hypothetical protein [Richelia sp. RM2_1_2]
MAFYIMIFKEREDLEKAIYSFGLNEEKLSCLQINKIDGKIEEVRQVPVENPSAFFNRAAIKIYRHWKNGELPEKTI